MPFDLGDDTAGFCPASGLIGEVRAEAAHFVRRTPDRAREQVANPLLQDPVGGSRIAYLTKVSTANLSESEK